MTTETPKRHRWSKDELAHLNRTVSHSSNKTDAFKKVGIEMNIPWERVRSTYNNHHKSIKPKVMAKKATDRVPSFRKTPSYKGQDFASCSIDEMNDFVIAIKSEVARRIDLLQAF